jgi:glycosyltransferase involved in cell wall biosynthesis
LERDGTGIRSVVKGLVEEMAGLERVALITDSGPAARRLAEEYPGTTVAVIPKSSWLWWEQARLARYLRHAQPRIFVAPANFGVPLLTRRATKVVLVVHDLIPLVMPRRYLTSRPAWALMYLVATGIALARADLVVAVSDATARDVRRFSGRRPVVSHPRLPTRPCRSERPRRPESEDPYVLFNGGMDPRKNLRVLVDAFALFCATPTGSAFRLAVLGDVPEDVVGQINAAGIGDRCVLTGQVPDEEKWEWLAGASCVAYPSTYEGFGLVVAEAFACGTPVVTSSGGSLAEVGGEAVVRIDPGDTRSLAAGLAAAVDPDRRAALVAAGFAQLERLRSRSGGILSIIETSSSRVGAKGLLYGRRRPITRRPG